jgi:hypothetical protein
MGGNLHGRRRPSCAQRFHQGGTLTGDIQGESAFDPHANINPTSGQPKSSNASKLPLNVIVTPFSGVWQKTDFNTFGATFEVIEYQVQTKPPAAPVFQLTKGQYFGTLNASADRMTLRVLLTHYDVNGKVTDTFGPFDASGVRIPVETSPSTGNLPIPGVPPNRFCARYLADWAAETFSMIDSLSVQIYAHQYTPRRGSAANKASQHPSYHTPGTSRAMGQGC